MPTPKENAIKVLVTSGLKEDFAKNVVEKSGVPPQDIAKDPIPVVDKYWAAHADVDFLDQHVATNESEFKRGLGTLQFQDKVITDVLSSKVPAGMFGHRDVFSWGNVIMRGRLA